MYIVYYILVYILVYIILYTSIYTIYTIYTEVVGPTSMKEVDSEGRPMDDWNVILIVCCVLVYHIDMPSPPASPARCLSIYY